MLTREVRAGVFDFAIVPAFPGGSGLSVRPFLTTRETLVSAKKGGPLGRLPHLAPVRLSSAGPLRLVLPGPLNTRRQTLTTYFTTHGVEVDRTMELDAMMGTLDYVASSEWVTILPAVMMAGDIPGGRFKVTPIVDPRLDLELVSIQPSRRALKPAAAAFFSILAAETRRLNETWNAKRS